MKRLSLIAVSLSALMIAGSAYAQDATTRGGAKSVMPSTPQNSQVTGETTGANKGANMGATSGAGMQKSMKKTKSKKNTKMM